MLNKEILKFILLSEMEDVIVTLESIMEWRKGNAIIITIESKSDTVDAVKKIILKHGLNSTESLKNINAEIKQLLSKKTSIIYENSSNKTKQLFFEKKVVNEENSLDKDNKTETDKSVDSVFKKIKNNIYLTDMEKQSLLSRWDSAFEATAISDLPDKTRRHYYRLAGAKIRILKILNIEGGLL